MGPARRDGFKLGAVHLALALSIILQLSFSVSQSFIIISNNNNNNKSSSIIEKDEPAAEAGCNPESEFRCESDGSCIPIEWKCDFTRQCLNGEDEFGCVMEHCEFEHDLCNWRATTGRDSLGWRRYFVRGLAKMGHLSTSRPQPALQFNNGGDLHRSAQSIERMLSAKLNELANELEPNSKFLFIPMVLDARRGRQGAQVNQSSKLQKSRTTMNDNNTLIEAATSVAHLRTPLISQTNSVCQLRFKYALWAGAGQVNLVASKLRLSLSLIVSHQQPGRGRRESGVVWSKTVESAQSVHRDKLAEEPFESEREPANGTSFWFVEVLELGHLRQIELDFEARASLLIPGLASGSFGASQRLRVSANNNINNHLPDSSPLGGSLVAFEWLSFQGCAWPRGEQIREELEFSDWDSHERPSERTMLASYLHSSSIEGEAAPADEYPLPAGSGDSGNCEPRQFECQSSGVCLDDWKLCNYVNDCMGDPPRDGQAAADNNNNNNNEDDNDNTEIGAGEDELADLCGSIPGRQDFERDGQSWLLRAREQIGSPEAFWSLSTGNWRAELIRIEGDEYLSKASSPSNASHFPRRDHTRNSALGHYLSFEIPTLTTTTITTTSNQPASSPPPPPPPTSSQQITGAAPQSALGDGRPQLEPELHWAHLDSPWLRKLDKESGDCRVKFFYNLVSANPSVASQWSQLEGLPFRLYLVVEHFVLEKQTQLANNINNNNNTSTVADKAAEIKRQHSAEANQFGLSRVVDSFTYSHLVDYERLIVANGRGGRDKIEFPGLDFWRQVNSKLADLNEGDLFYTRIAIIVTNDGTSGHKLGQVNHRLFKTTLNIDDLSTHFGCAQVDDPKVLASIKSARMHLMKSFSINDYLAKVPTIGRPQQEQIGSPELGQTGRLETRRRRRNGPTEPAAQFETQKLIFYVFGVLASIMGMIMVIVFIVVPYVERITISYHDQLSVGLSDIVGAANYDGSRDSRSSSGGDSSQLTDTGGRYLRTGGRPRRLALGDTCELTTDFDWEQVSSGGLRGAASISESTMTSSLHQLAPSNSIPSPAGLSTDSFTSLAINNNNNNNNQSAP